MNMTARHTTAIDDKRKRTHAKGNGSLILRGNIYQARWVVNGKTYSRSTKTGVKREAEERLREYTDAFRTKDEKHIVENLSARVQGLDARIEALDRDRTALRLRAAWTAYVNAQNRPDSGKVTMDRYEAEYGRLMEWLAENNPNVTHIQQIDQSVADAFMAHIGATLSPNTYNKYRTFLKCMWRTLAQSARLDANPWANIRRKTYVQHSRRELTLDELKRVCLSLTGEMRLLFALGIYTGLRLGDCANLGWGNIDLARGIISTIPSKTARHANGKPTIIPIHPTLAGMLAETPAAKRRGFVVPDTANTYNSDPTILSGRIQAIFEGNGIKTQADKPRNGERTRVDVGFHSLRHTFVSLSANAGAPLALVQAIVGHSNPAMTRHYFHESTNALKTAVAALPDVTGTNANQEAENEQRGKFDAFRAIVDGMTDCELKEAAEYINRLTRYKD